MEFKRVNFLFLVLAFIAGLYLRAARGDERPSHRGEDETPLTLEALNAALIHQNHLAQDFIELQLNPQSLQVLLDALAIWKKNQGISELLVTEWEMVIEKAPARALSPLQKQGLKVLLLREFSNDPRAPLNRGQSLDLEQALILAKTKLESQTGQYVYLPAPATKNEDAPAKGKPALSETDLQKLINQLLARAKIAETPGHPPSESRASEARAREHTRPSRYGKYTPLPRAGGKRPPNPELSFNEAGPRKNPSEKKSEAARDRKTPSAKKEAPSPSLNREEPMMAEANSMGEPLSGSPEAPPGWSGRLGRAAERMEERRGEPRGAEALREAIKPMWENAERSGERFERPERGESARSLAPPSSFEGDPFSGVGRGETIYPQGGYVFAKPVAYGESNGSAPAESSAKSLGEPVLANIGGSVGRQFQPTPVAQPRTGQAQWLMDYVGHWADTLCPLQKPCLIKSNRGKNGSALRAKTVHLNRRRAG